MSLCHCFFSGDANSESVIGGSTELDFEQWAQSLLPEISKQFPKVIVHILIAGWADISCVQLGDTEDGKAQKHVPPALEFIYKLSDTHQIADAGHGSKMQVTDIKRLRCVSACIEPLAEQQFQGR